MPEEIKKKILIIDDEQDIGALVRENLESTGKFEVQAISDPLQAEETCRAFHPDLVLLDLVMPKRNGKEVAEAIRKDHDLHKIPIIIMSGLGEMVYFKKKDEWKWLPNTPIVRERGKVKKYTVPWQAAEAYGVDDYLEKPFKTDILLDAIEKVLEEAAQRAKKPWETPSE